jgi:4-methyl-5(b-hydroxyethyl)-thiazole monophosphate biosynthesis
MTRVLVPLADGVEEMEAVILVDVFRRAAWEVTCAAVRTPEGSPPGAPLTASRGVRITAEIEWTAPDVGSYDLLALPGGGGGAQVLSAFAPLLAFIREFDRAGKWIGAICAAPLVLQAAGILKDRMVTSYPSVQSQLDVPAYSDEAVVVDGNVITSRGPGTAFDFALTLVRLIDGECAADAVRRGLLL